MALGYSVTPSHYVDANLYHDMISVNQLINQKTSKSDSKKHAIWYQPEYMLNIS